MMRKNFTWKVSLKAQVEWKSEKVIDSIIIIIILINRFVLRHKVVTSEALEAGSVLGAEKEGKAWEKRNVFSLD